MIAVYLTSIIGFGLHENIFYKTLLVYWAFGLYLSYDLEKIRKREKHAWLQEDDVVAGALLMYTDWVRIPSHIKEWNS